jgi:hypothetical protein
LIVLQHGLTECLNSCSSEVLWKTLSVELSYTHMDINCSFS